MLKPKHMFTVLGDNQPKKDTQIGDLKDDFEEYFDDEKNKYGSFKEFEYLPKYVKCNIKPRTGDDGDDGDDEDQ